MEPLPPEALLAESPAELAVIGERLREIVRTTMPEAVERVRTGWHVIGYDLPLGRRRTRFFAWIMPQQEHIHLGFVFGAAMDDLYGLLHGQRGVKRARWTTFEAGDELDVDALADLLTQAAFVAGLPPEARFWRE
jgi:hypothetical protein